jgi:cell division septation protein DedD
VYFGIDSSLIALRSRTLQVSPAIHLGADVRAVAPTPSGDRLFVATDSSRTLTVIDRYRDQIERSIELPGAVSALRMDPLGRYVLARSAKEDSAWVVAVGTARVIGSVATEWRDDLPLVAPDGAIVLAQGENVAIVDGETLRPRSDVRGGARDFWQPIIWNGFRPRSGELDQPVTFADSDSTSRAATPDTGILTPPKRTPDTANGQTASGQTTAPRTPRTAIPRPAPPRLPVDTPATAAPQASRPKGWVVSFAAFVSEPPARERAATIAVEGQKARVVTGETNGTTIYRVILGPYPTKADAERIGRASRVSFWVYEGNP